MQTLLDEWHGLNELAETLEPKRSKKSNTIVTWDKQEKIGALNTITSGIEWLGAFRHQSSSVGEKAHIGLCLCFLMPHLICLTKT
jgi:hypothetical protein